MSQAGVLNTQLSPPAVPLQFTTDNGIAIPAANNLNVLGGDGVETFGAGSTITIVATAEATEYTNVTFAMSPYTVTATDYYISVNSTGGPVVINLPDTPTANREFVIKDRLGQANVNSITVKSLGGVTTVDGQASYIFADAYESLECLYNSNNYEIF